MREGRLSRNQYIYTLSELHQFVRWTTRVLAAAASLSKNRELRLSFIEHLKGEIDHDLIIGADLAHIGADVVYIRDHRAPSPEMRSFMAVQESLLSFHHDPVTYLAVPFTVEGLSGFLSPSLIKDLELCVSSWGIKGPKKATSFLRSHVAYDGGDDGHWERSRRMIAMFVRSEKEMREFLAASDVIYEAMNGMFKRAASIKDPATLRGA